MSTQHRTTDKYRKVFKDRQQHSDKTPENEVKISAGTSISRYITYTARLLLEKNLDVVQLKASGLACRDAVQVAEILRHNITGLHQENSISTVEVVDEYEPLEEGLERVQVKRNLAVLEIRLSKKAGILKETGAGYQKPLEINTKQEEELKNILAKKAPFRLAAGEEGGRRFGGRGRGRGRGRGGFGRGRGGDREGGFRGGRGRGFGGRGRGRGFGGRGRGGPRSYREGEERGEEREGGYRGGYRTEGNESRGGYREGGYRGGDREGGESRGGYREGGYRGDREGGYRGGDREGGYRGGRGGGFRGGRGAPRGRGGRGRGDFRGEGRGDFRGERRD